jgi:hypothetical protein
VRGYEIETIAQTFVPLAKSRETDFVQNNPTTFSAGNYARVENVYGTPDLGADGSDSKPFKDVELRDQRMPVTHLAESGFDNSETDVTVDSTERMPSTGTFVVQIDNELMNVTALTGIATNVLTVTRGYLGTDAAAHDENTPIYVWGMNNITSITPSHGAENGGLARRAKTIGVARTRAYEVSSSATATLTGAHPRTSKFEHYLFDVRMLTKLTMNAASKFTATNWLHNGARIKGSVSGATGIVYITAQDVKFDMAGCTASGTTITVPSTAGLEVGMGVAASSNITAGTYLTAINTGTTATLSVAAGGNPGTTTFGNAVDADDGTKIDAGTTFHVIQTTGYFVSTDVISSNFSGHATVADLATSGTSGAGPTVYTFADAHSIYGANNGTAGRHYMADLSMQDTKKLTGTANASGVTLTGTNTQFSSDLKVGDLFEVDAAGTTKRMEVKAIASDVSLTTVETFPAAATNSIVTRVRAKIEEQEELVMLSKLPKNAVKTLKATELNNKVDTTLTVRRQNTLTLSGGLGSFSVPEGESFSVPFTADDYVLSVVSTGSSKFPVGTVLQPSDAAGSACRVEITTSSFSLTLGSGGTAKVKVTFTVDIATANEKTKTLQPMTQLHIPATTVSGAFLNKEIYGTNFTDDEISLMKADIFNVRAVFMSATNALAAVPPTISYTTSAGNITSADIFQAGAKVVGSNGSIARIINGSYTGTSATTQVASFAYLTTKTFTTTTTLTSDQNTSPSGTLTVSAIEPGDENILSNYTVDTGMRDTFYDLGSIVRKAGLAPPTGRLLIVFDYFTHGAGNYFSVDSYPVGTSAASITYGEIPIYSAQRVDPDNITPSGEYDLRDSVDFRPRVADYLQSNAYTTGTFSVSPFSFKLRDFEAGSASLVDVPKTDATFITSFNYYLANEASLYLDKDGDFKTVVGGAGEVPELPKSVSDSMKLAQFFIPQYTFDTGDVFIERTENKRYTMRDIGAIENRVANIEYYSHLSLLEKDTDSFQMQDADGLDRFKNGFVVDNFAGHATGDPTHPDYQNSMDMVEGILRPEFKHRMVELEESVSTDAARTAAGYQKTGDLITLPYTETTFISQPYASRIENVNPFNVISWVGSITLDPASDIWKDTNRMPKLIINREGNYDTFIARNGGSAVNTVWNEWQTFALGRIKGISSSRTTKKTSRRGRLTTVKTSITREAHQSRSGIKNTVKERIDHKSIGDRLVSTDILPYCRARDVNFTGKIFKPRTRLFAFFDNVDVTQYCKPTIPYINKYAALTTAITSDATLTGSSGHRVYASTSVFDTSGSFQIDDEIFTYTNKASTYFESVTRATSSTSAAAHSAEAVVYKTSVAGDPIITGATGKHAGVFSIPDPNVSGNPAFKVGERVFRMTSDPANGTINGDTETAGEATYFAKGLLDNIRESVIATRNAELVSESANPEKRTVSSTRNFSFQFGWIDPIAQSFIAAVKGGVFITSINVYFQSKSDSVPVQCQIRTMKTGYPTTTILPFGKAEVDPSDVQISEDASLPTRFTFPSPIYLQHNIEYCFVILANTQDYMVWLSHMGDVEVGGNRTISEQPYAGVMFKSQNASTWSAVQMEDLKFSIDRASFSTSPGVITLQNTALPTTTLGTSPVISIPGTKKIKVRHLNHGMYKGASNYVTIAGLAGTIAYASGSYNLATANGTFTSLIEVGLDHYVIDLSLAHGGQHTVPTSTFNEAKVTGGAGGTATENYMMDTGSVTLQTMEIAGTDVVTKIRTTSGTSASGATGVLGGGETPFQLLAGSSAKEVTLSENVNFIEPKMVASPINEANNMSGNKSLEALCTLTSPLENVSPVLDMQRMGMVAVQNRLNNVNVNTDYYSSDTLGRSTVFSDAYKPKTAATGDINAAVYLTRKISLANASTSLKVMFDAVLFSTANIDVFYKALSSDDTTPFENLEWTEMTIDKIVAESKNLDDFRERTYEVAGLEGFIAFAVKLVMRGTKSTEPPYIKDFRAIALAL